MTEEKSLGERVRDTVRFCLYKPEELDGDNAPEGAIIVHGVRKTFGFHPNRLKQSRRGIKRILEQMPSQFMKNEGGGWSFLNLCVDKDGNQWAEHPTIDDLVCLGLATGMVSFCIMPREMWSALPGGVPYISIDTEVKEENENG